MFELAKQYDTGSISQIFQISVGTESTFEDHITDQGNLNIIQVS